MPKGPLNIHLYIYAERIKIKKEVGERHCAVLDNVGRGNAGANSDEGDIKHLLSNLLRDGTVAVLADGLGRDSSSHRIDRVLGFYFSRPNWDSPAPSPAGEVVPPLWFRGGHTRLRELEWGGGGGPNSDMGSDTVGL